MSTDSHPGLGNQSSGLSDCETAAFRYKRPLTAATWNVRGGINSEDKLLPIIQAARRLNLDILSIQETAIPGSGAEGYPDGWRLLWSGPDQPAHFTGVALLLSPAAGASLISWRPVSPRLITATFQCCRRLTLTVLGYYAPHSSRPAADRAAFRSLLQQTRHSVNPRSLHLELADANAKVGTAQDGQTFGGALGPHGTGTRNEAGTAFLDDCAAEGLAVANSFFQHRDIHKLSCRTPSAHQLPGQPVKWDRHAIDVVVIRRGFLSSVRDVRVFRCVNPNFSYDHHPVVVTIKLRLHGIRRPRAYPDISLLATDAEVREKYNNRLDEELALIAAGLAAAAPEQQWDMLCKVMLAASAVVPTLPAHHACRPPPSARLLELTKSRRDFLARLPANSRRTRSQTSELRGRGKQIKQEVQRLKQERLDQVCVELKAAAMRGDLGRTWATLDIIAPRSGPNSRTGRRAIPEVIKDNAGVPIPIPAQQRDHLASFYSGLLNDGIGCTDDAVPSLAAPAPLGPLPPPAVPPPSPLSPPPPPSPGSQPSCPAPSWEETALAMRALKNGKAPGPNGVRNEHIKYASRAVQEAIHGVLVRVWADGLPTALKVSDLVSLPKKGDSGYAHNRRGVQILDKMYQLKAMIFADRLAHATEDHILELQCGFRRQRGCCDQRCTLQLAIDEAVERCRPLHVALVDLEKAFDRVDRNALFAIMQHYGASGPLLDQAKDLLTDTSARVRWQGRRSEAFAVTWGVQQGSPASTFQWNLYVNIIVEQTLAELGPDAGVQIFTKIDGRLARPAAPPPDALHARLTMLLLADDITITAESTVALQRAIDVLDRIVTRWGMRISATKTKVLHFERPAVPVPRPPLTLGTAPLEAVTHAKYLGSHFSTDGSIDREITARLSAANGAAARLRNFWRRGRVGVQLKLMFYKTAVLTVLLYGAESWPTTAAQIQRLEVFHQRRLREILGIPWQAHVSNEEVFAGAQVASIAATVAMRRLTWLGHIARMEDSRLVKQLLFSQQPGQRQRQRPRLTLRRAMEQDVCALHGGQPNGRSWYVESQDRAYWQQAVLALRTAGVAGVAGGDQASDGLMAGDSSRQYRSLTRI